MPNRMLRGAAPFPLVMCLAALFPVVAQAQVITVTPLPTPRKSPAAKPPRPRPRPAAPSKPVFRKPTLVWKTFLRRVDGSPASTERVSFLGAGSYLYQIDSGGRTLWATETGNQQSTPVLDDDKAYVGSDRGILYAIRRKTGVVAWQFAGASATNTIQTRPVVHGGVVVFESTDNSVYGLDAVSGKQKWKFTRADGSLGYSSPRFGGASALYVCGETTLYRLDLKTGKEQWRALMGGKSASTPDVGGGRAYVGGDGTGLSAFSLDSGARLWNFKGAQAADWFGAPLYADGTVYVATDSRYVYALDAPTGKIQWSYRLLGSSLSQPAVDARRGVLYVASTTFRDNPTLTALDIKTGRSLWSYRVGYVGGSPVISGDWLYVGTTDGYYYCFALD
ncbi:MAG: PQQ-binding-like beta-propeller repeat protein [Cytophagales bacterium]|nr:PQQ-binding-like beta-propeller repeat protein [Armatimonadota bacterium]